jgi:hypothetical protein
MVRNRVNDEWERGEAAALTPRENGKFHLLLRLMCITVNRFSGLKEWKIVSGGR